MRQSLLPKENAKRSSLAKILLILVFIFAVACLSQMTTFNGISDDIAVGQLAAKPIVFYYESDYYIHTYGDFFPINHLFLETVEKAPAKMQIKFILAWSDDPTKPLNLAEQHIVPYVNQIMNSKGPHETSEFGDTKSGKVWGWESSDGKEISVSIMKKGEPDNCLNILIPNPAITVPFYDIDTHKCKYTDQQHTLQLVAGDIIKATGFDETILARFAAIFDGYISCKTDPANEFFKESCASKYHVVGSAKAIEQGEESMVANPKTIHEWAEKEKELSRANINVGPLRIGNSLRRAVWENTAQHQALTAFFDKHAEKKVACIFLSLSKETGSQAEEAQYKAFGQALKNLKQDNAVPDFAVVIPGKHVDGERLGWSQNDPNAPPTWFKSDNFNDKWIEFPLLYHRCHLVVNNFGAGSLFEPLLEAKPVMPFYKESNDAEDKQWMARLMDENNLCALEGCSTYENGWATDSSESKITVQKYQDGLKAGLTDFQTDQNKINGLKSFQKKLLKQWCPEGTADLELTTRCLDNASRTTIKTAEYLIHLATDDSKPFKYFGHVELPDLTEGEVLTHAIK